jgi:hypothetical protein
MREKKRNPMAEPGGIIRLKYSWRFTKILKMFT